MKPNTIIAILGALAILYGCGTSRNALGRTESQRERTKVIEHTEYIKEYGIDMPEVTDWYWK